MSSFETSAVHLLDLTLETPAENVALDEALLESAERGEGPSDVLRLWEPRTPMVVIGRSSKIADETHVDRDKPLPPDLPPSASLADSVDCWDQLVPLRTNT